MSQIIAEKGLMFVHVPKTGGTSISKVLGPIDLGHRPSWDFDCPEKFWKFAFIRDPHERFLSAASAHLYLNRKPPYTVDKQPTIQQIRDEMWRVIDIISPNGIYPAVPLRIYEKSPEFNGRLLYAPQIYWLTDENDEICVDFIGRYENLASDWKYIAGRFDLNPTLPKYRYVGNSRPPAEEIWTDVLWKSVLAIYSLDFKFMRGLE